MCFVNITNPPFYKRECADKQDSQYYKYSIGGFDPCHFFDFSQQYTINYKLHCQVLDESGFVNTEQENIGYKYRDVIRQAFFKDKYTKDGLEFHYAATNPQTRFSISQP